MIHIVKNNIIWQDTKVGIIFNPVSVSDTKMGREVFNPLLKSIHPNVYNEYTDYIYKENPKRLLSDIQLVKIKDDRFVMNGYCYMKNKINLLALTKCLVELFNLAERYHVDIALPLNMGTLNPFLKEQIKLIINTVFENCIQEVYVYL